jgi:hypothetical protein
MTPRKARYDRPMVQTISGERIVELMGPVSCGSGGNLHPLPYSRLQDESQNGWSNLGR